MQMSARILGKSYGLTAEEMNRVLVKQGFLEGEPGEYNVTSKALKYAVEKDFHRGNGGYSRYNCYWTTRTFDDSIKEVLDITPELIKGIRNEISADRAAKALARKEASVDLLVKQAAEKVPNESFELGEMKTNQNSVNWTGIIGILLTIAVGFGICFFVPKVIQWWKNRSVSKKSENNPENKDGNFSKETLDK